MQLSKNCRSFNATGKILRENWRTEPKLARAPYARLRALRYGAAAFGSCFAASEGWWAREDSNLRPCAYQAHALTN
jgi:hypothetical protein